MPKNTSVTLDQHFTGFIDRQIEEGRYGSASEAVRAALQLLDVAKLGAPWSALVEGEQSGPRVPAWLGQRRHGSRRTGSFGSAGRSARRTFPSPLVQHVP
jgi:antitoxin ParD1/3/4